MNKPVLQQKEIRKLKLLKKPADIQLFTSRNETENTTEVLPKSRYYKLEKNNMTV